MDRIARVLAIVATSLAIAPTLTGQTLVPLSAFNSVDVRNGGHVVVRGATAQRVTILKGSLEYSRVAVTNGELVIDYCGVRECPRGYELEIEIQTPGLSRLALANGGRIQAVGAFAPQTDLSAVVMHGGTIDIRAMLADKVTATVEQGGRILTIPRGSLSARVFQGGAIIYWGNAKRTESIDHGGVIVKGSAEEISLPLSAIGTPIQRE